MHHVHTKPKGNVNLNIIQSLEPCADAASTGYSGCGGEGVPCTCSYLASAGYCTRAGFEALAEGCPVSCQPHAAFGTDLCAGTRAGARRHSRQVQQRAQLR